jgi:rare lipoprotein A
LAAYAERLHGEDGLGRTEGVFLWVRWGVSMSRRLRAESFCAPITLRVTRAAVVITAAVAPILLSACSSSRDVNLPSVGMRQSQAQPKTYEPKTYEPKIAYGSRVAQGPAVRAGGGGYKLGSPYKIGNVWYVPHEDPSYDRTGVASWYGADFHGRKTANGEIYNMNALSAAHPTLPIPSYVYVTNIANNRTILVRVNDRGPYVGGRMIDLSRAAAQALDYETKGTANVRVRYSGRAPLNGDDSRERSHLASQPWHHNAIAVNEQPASTWHPAKSAQQAYAAPAYAQPATEPPGGGWTPDMYRRGLTQPKAAPAKDSTASWQRVWGLGGQ